MLVGDVVLERVAQIFASLRDLDTTLRQWLMLVKELSGAPNGGIYLREEERGLFLRWREAPGTPDLHIPIHVVEGMFGAKDYVVVSMSDPRFTGESMEAVDASKAAGMHGAIGFAMRFGGTITGVLGLGYPHAPEVPEATLRTLATVARFPAAAIQHARTQEVADRRAREAEILRRFGEQALATEDIAALHNVILESAQALTGSDQVSITRVENNLVRMVAGIGKDEPLVGTTAPVSMLREALSPENPYLVRDVNGADQSQLLVKLARRTGAGSFIALPLKHQTRLFGHLFAGAAEAFRYRDDEVEAIRILASMAAAVLEQRSAHAEAEQQARRVAAVIEHVPTIIEVYDGQGRLMQSNATARAMRAALQAGAPTPEDRAGGLTMLTLDGRVMEASELPSRRALQGETVEPREVVLSRNGERLATMVIAAAPIRSPDGTIESVVVGCQDVTKLHELARAKDRFLRVAAHELRTPITALHATTQLIDIDPEAFSDAERRGAVLQRIRRQSVRLVKLVQQLLDSVQANASELPLSRAPVDLVALARDVVDTTMPAAGPRAVVSADAPVIGRWDALRIEQVLTNLLSNAARYSPAEKEVTVIVRAEEGEAMLQVRDQGIGIPADQLELLFTPFFRAANAHAHHGAGLGLGLHIAQEIVRRHGGRIHVESKENSGTTFTVRLPLG
jgi:signal transduction histidine kinase/GAF domain-containing protein